MALPILTYHRILAETPTKERDPMRIAVSVDQFRQQMTWLKRLGYRTFPLERYSEIVLNNHSLPARSVAITFDDGYEDVITRGLPVLRDLGFTATIFAVAEELGGRNTWDGGNAALMSAEHYKEWSNAGMAIGVHSCRHKHLPQVDPDTLRHEIIDARRLLEDALHQKLSTFAYPYGETDHRVEAVVKEAGYTLAYATDRAARRPQENPYRIRRVVVFPKNSVMDILHKIQPWYPAYQDWKRRGDVGL